MEPQAAAQQVEHGQPGHAVPAPGGENFLRGDKVGHREDGNQHSGQPSGSGGGQGGKGAVQEGHQQEEGEVGAEIPVCAVEHREQGGDHVPYPEGAGGQQAEQRRERGGVERGLEPEGAQPGEGVLPSHAQVAAEQAVAVHRAGAQGLQPPEGPPAQGAGGQGGEQAARAADMEQDDHQHGHITQDVQAGEPGLYGL